MTLAFWVEAKLARQIIFASFMVNHSFWKYEACSLKKNLTKSTRQVKSWPKMCPTSAWSKVPTGTAGMISSVTATQLIIDFMNTISTWKRALSIHYIVLRFRDFRKNEHHVKFEKKSTTNKTFPNIFGFASLLSWNNPRIFFSQIEKILSFIWKSHWTKNWFNCSSPV